jgi:type IV secretory pathway VirB4 component
MYKDKLKFKTLENGDKAIDRSTIPLLRDIIPVIDDFIKTVASQKHKEQLLDIKEKFSPFIGEGSFAGLLDRVSNIELKSSFVVFDISGLPTNRDDILSLAIYIISNFSMQRFKINKKMQKRQVLVIDEAWFLARFSGGQNFLLELGKRSRHLALTPIIATQQVSDFLGNEEAKKILTSAPTKILFRQSPEDMPLIRELYRLNDSEMSLLSSLKQVRGSFSEAFYICGNDKNIIQVRADRVAYWIATSDTNKEVPMRDNEFKRTGDYWKTVINLAERGV